MTTDSHPVSTTGIAALLNFGQGASKKDDKMPVARKLLVANAAPLFQNVEEEEGKDDFRDYVSVDEDLRSTSSKYTSPAASAVIRGERTYAPSLPLSHGPAPFIPLPPPPPPPPPTTTTTSTFSSDLRHLRSQNPPPSLFNNNRSHQRAASVHSEATMYDDAMSVIDGLTVYNDAGPHDGSESEFGAGGGSAWGRNGGLALDYSEGGGQDGWRNGNTTNNTTFAPPMFTSRVREAWRPRGDSQDASLLPRTTTTPNTTTQGPTFVLASLMSSSSAHVHPTTLIATSPSSQQQQQQPPSIMNKGDLSARIVSSPGMLKPAPLVPPSPSATAPFSPIKRAPTPQRPSLWRRLFAHPSSLQRADPATSFSPTTPRSARSPSIHRVLSKIKSLSPRQGTTTSSSWAKSTTSPSRPPSTMTRQPSLPARVLTSCLSCGKRPATKEEEEDEFHSIEPPTVLSRPVYR